jgi:hypothetical protein
MNEVARTAVVTVAARNYLALASSLLASISECEPDLDRFVFVTDDLDEREVLAEGRIIAPADVFSRDAYAKLARDYDVTELATAVKPSVLRYLLDRDYDRVFYFDPDIQVFAPLAAVMDPLKENDIVLTPHVTEPVPLDGKRPTEIDLLRGGSYNLGFIGVANTSGARAMIAWWAERLERHCLNDVTSGLFFDQKWIDLVPALFPRTAIVQHRGCNVAYWNLHSRPLGESDPPRLASGEAVIFFHYSSFDARKPERLSRFQTRIDVAREPALGRLLASYARRVIERGHLERRKLPYGLARFSPRAGVRWLARQAYWQARRLLYWSSEGSRA